MKRLACFGFAACALALAGCGGSSGGVNPSNSAVKFTIDWGARSRDIAAPSSALSATVALTGANLTGGDLVAEVDRHSDPGAYVETYTSQQVAKPGTYPLSVTFYSGAGATGTVVAIGTATVTIKSDGTGIGTVTVINKITSVTVNPGQIVLTPQTVTLGFTAKDANNNLVAVSPGSAMWTQIDGASSLSLATDGKAIGLQRGLSNVRVTVDGVQSGPATVEAGANPGGSPIVLGFDDIPAMSTQVRGTAIPPANRLSTRYLSTQGITFGSVASYVAVSKMPDDTAPTAPNSICGAAIDGTISYGQSTPVTFTFFDPLKPTVAGVTKSFSVTADKDGRADNTVEIDAYDVAGNLIGRKTFSDSGGEVMSISFGAAVIHKVVFLGAPTPNDGVALDNVTFGPVVPATSG